MFNWTNYYLTKRLILCRLIFQMHYTKKSPLDQVIAWCQTDVRTSRDHVIRFGLQIVYVCLYIRPSQYHHCAKLSEDIELIKCLSDTFCRVCKIKHIISVIHYTICRAVCFQFTHSPCDDWDNIYILCLIIITKSEVWNVILSLGLGHETMACLWICDMAWLLCRTFVSWWYLPQIWPSITTMLGTLLMIDT